MVRCGNLDGRSRQAQDPVIVFEVLSSSSATGRSPPSGRSSSSTRTASGSSPGCASTTTGVRRGDAAEVEALLLDGEELDADDFISLVVVDVAVATEVFGAYDRACWLLQLDIQQLSFGVIPDVDIHAAPPSA